MKAELAAAALALSTLGLVAAGAAGAQTHGASYTRQQAWEGRLDYYRSCAECHGGKLEGNFGPALAGGDDNLQYQSGSAVYAYMSAHMPHGDPESLPQGEYLAIMAFLMQAHGIADGPHALTKVMIDADTALLGHSR